MESKKEIEINEKIPKEKRIRTNETEGKFDNDGFFRTPNGSFWDMDGEYFNRYGYDIHGGKYLDTLDYIPGPTWIEELGCYPEDKEKYQKEDIDIDDDINDKDLDLDLLGGGEEINIKDFENLGLNEKEKKENNEDIKNDINIKKENKKDKKTKNKKNKKKKEESYDEDEWEEIEDE